jgi:DNA-binding LytR/AlgR family response regulator
LHRSWAVEVARATAVGAFLGLIGPFGSYLNGPAWQRVAYWVAMTWLGYGLFALTLRPLLNRVRGRLLLACTVVAHALIMTLPFSWLSWTLARSIWPRLDAIPSLTPSVWRLQCLIIAAPQLALVALRAHRDPGRQGADLGPAPGLLGARPQEVLCLSMEDHYVRVHTAGGSRLVLATMRQAVDALDGAPGLRVHRSWWVAEAAVADAIVERRNLRLRLVNGQTAPVARASVAAVRRAGWIATEKTPEAARA